MLRNAQRQVRLDLRRLQKTAQTMLAAIGKPKGTLSILLTDDQEMAKLHERWMGEPRPTDVLSFAMGSPQVPRGAPRHPWPPLLLGDVAISVETAARRRPRDVQAEVTRYLIHGLLHLVGYTHARKRDKDRMNREAERLWRSLN